MHGFRTLAGAFTVRLQFFMAREKQQPRRRKKERNAPRFGVRESQTAEAATVAWTVSVTMVVACDLAAVAAHVYLLYNPTEKRAGMFGGLMLLSGALIGAGSLALLPVVYRLRRTPPPTGFVVFAVCAAAAPILALAARAWTS
jgi:hypothetical protein